MEAIVRKSLKDIAIEKIKQYIEEHKLQSGDRFLNEKEIIDMLGVSRTVVREALKSLETLGMLKLKPGDGIYVSDASLQQVVGQFAFRWQGDQRKMLELLETRLILEMAAVELVIQRATPELLAQLEVWNSRLDKEGIDTRTLVEIDIGFHRTLFKMTGNETFYELSEVISRFFSEIRSQHLASGQYANTLRGHRQIVELIRKKDVAKAKKAMFDHLNKVKLSLEQISDQP